MFYKKSTFLRLLSITFLVLLICNQVFASFFEKTFDKFQKSIQKDLAVAEQIFSKKSYVLPFNTSKNCGSVVTGSQVASCTGAPMTIGGNVYEDADFNGSLNVGVEAGITGIEVYIYDDTNTLVDSTTTDAEGDFLFENLADDKYRVEFNIPDAISCWAKPTVSGTDNTTMVRIVAPGNCINQGVVDPANYCNTNSKLATTCFIDGEPSLGGTSGEGDVLISYDYNSNSTDINKVALNKEIGSVWGLAYDKINQDFFVGAMLKRHTGFGPLGIDGIYRIDMNDPSNPVIDNWLELETLGVNVGTDPRTYNLPADAGIGHADPQGFGDIGKLGIGDVDITDDGQTLYVMNLNNNGSLVIIDVASKSLINEVSIGNPGCGTATDFRPWGIEIHNNQVYIGGVCSGQAAGASDLNFYVLRLDGTSFTSIFSASLDYPKGFVYPSYNMANPADADLCGKWEVWSDDFSGIHTAGMAGVRPRWCRPQAILSDMEFDNDGSIILGFMDRAGHQTGYNQLSTDGALFGNGYVGGDILRVHNNNGTFELENQGTTAAGGGCGLNGEGPGGGEYYCGEVITNLHSETSLGALAFLGTDGQVALNVMDPLNVFSAGTAWLSNADGTAQRAIELYNSHEFTGPPEVGTFGKAAGLGDLELFCEPVPIEIGNLIWEDTDTNGIQDPSELGIDGILVELLKDGQLIDTTRTTNGGKYAFGNNGARLMPNTNYTIRVNKKSFHTKPVITSLPIDSTARSYQRDNNGIMNGDYIEVAVTTGDVGCTNHDYDIGVTLLPSLCLGNLVWEDVNNDGQFNNGEKGLEGLEVILFDVGQDGQKSTADDVEIDRETTDTLGKYLFYHICEGDYYVKLLAGDGFYSSTGKGYDGANPTSHEPAADPDNDLDNDDNGTQMGTMIMSDIVTLSLGNEPINDEDTDAFTNTTVDFGLFRNLSLGNKIWIDNDNDGIFDANEKGANGIEVTLYSLGDDMQQDTEDDATVGVLKTDFFGCYNFTKLHPGKYWIKLTNGTPDGTVSSDGDGMNYSGSGQYEPNLNIDFSDNDDSGIQMGNMIISQPIDLFLNDEPINDADTLNFTNLSVDFGLFPRNEIKIESPCSCLISSYMTDKLVVLSTVANQSWSLKSGNGLYNASLSLLEVGTQMNFVGLENGFYRYELAVTHLDKVGYEACFTNGTDNLTIANSCAMEESCPLQLSTSTDGTPAPNADPNVKNIRLGNDGITRSDTLECGTKEYTFTDDGSIDGLYADTSARTDTYIFCPQDRWKVLQFNFSEFNVAMGDTLYVYDGINNNAPLAGKFSGTGVSQTGGWVASNCDPLINASGCLTFEFRTNNDNNKGTGWNGSFDCTERNIKIAQQDDLTSKLACANTFQTFTIRPATITAACGNLLDTQRIQIYGANGVLCKDTCIGGTETFDENFAIGQYLVEYTLKTDSTKTIKNILSVQAPNLVCNDDINIPLGSGCSAMITPDDLLENPCDTLTDTLYYFITLKGLDKNGNETILAEGGGRSGNYPMVSKEMLKDNCATTITATIERRYFDGLDMNICNQGKVSQSCSVAINLSDDTAPIFLENTTPDTFKLCLTEVTPEALGLEFPKAVDNCDTAAVTFLGATVQTDGAPCDTSRATLNWLATDVCGNTTTLNQSIVVIRPTMDEIVKPSNIVLSCGEDTETTFEDFARVGVPGIQVGKISGGVLEPTDTISLSEVDYTCGYILQRRDITLENDCGKKLYRYWDILDWCDTGSATTRLDTQLIELKDTLAPTFVEDMRSPQTIALSSDACTYDITGLDNPEATDNCSIAVVTLDSVFRIEDGTLWGIPSSQLTTLDCDSFQVRWLAEDACHEQLKKDTLHQIIIIEDNTPPSVLCTDKINLSLAGDDAELSVKDIDAGSSDACGIARMEVSRDGENWSDKVAFTCSDTHKEIKVLLRVIDQKGNQNTCWTLVNVEDKIAPICKDLPTITETCDAFHNGELGTSTDLNADGQMDDTEWQAMDMTQATLYNNRFGNPDCSDNLSCDDLTIEQQYQLIEKGCGRINIKRRYRAIDWESEGNISNWSIQEISIVYKENWTITLPADWEGECGDEIPTTDISISNGACDLMAYEIEEKVFTTVEDACIKVVRTITLVNWCNYQEGAEAVLIAREENQHGIVANSFDITSDDFENVGRLEYIQVLKLIDDTPPVVTIEEIDNCIQEAACEQNKVFRITATDCNSSSTEELTFTWNLSDENGLLASGTGATFEYAVTIKTNYNVEWKVSDKCGNTTIQNQPLQFIDCKKPSPYCLDGLAVDLMQGAGMVDIWARDFNHNSFDNCTSEEQLQIRLWHASLGEAPSHIADVFTLPKVIRLDCNYLGIQEVYLYVIDAHNNWDFCTTYIDVQDNTKTCANAESSTGMGLVSGTINDWRNRPVEEVMVETRDNQAILKQEMTQVDGEYAFELPMNGNYAIQPYKNSNPLNGVSTFDLVLISKHILGIQQLAHPYQYIAADVNNSGEITAFDMVQLRQLILNNIAQFPNNTSWRFVDANYIFQSSNPIQEDFPELVNVSELEGDMVMDFIAIKIGDVNGNASNYNQTTARSSEVFEISVDDIDLRKGESYIVPIQTEQLYQILGYQFTLAFEDLELVNLSEGIAESTNFGLSKSKEGYITTSWHKLTQENTKRNIESSTLFILELKALEDGKLSEKLRLMERPTSVEAYLSQQYEEPTVIGIALSFQEESKKQEFELYQNQPNPFTEHTQISFYLPQDGPVTLRVRDEVGRLVEEIKQDTKAGLQKINLNNHELPAGLLYYELSTNFGVKTLKMMKVN